MRHWKKFVKVLALLSIWYTPNIGSRTWSISSNPLIAKEKKEDRPVAPIYIALSIQWEGDSLMDYNLKSIEQIRKVSPGFPITHFISPAYFLKPRANIPEVKQKINSHISSTDSVGIHLSAWKSVLDASTVALKQDEPTFWGNKISQVNCAVDCGDSIALSSYSREEIDKIVTTSLATLESNGFIDIKSYIVKGWMDDRKIIDAAANRGLKYDFSPIALHLIRKRISNYPIYQKLAGIWPHISPYTQPFNVQTKNHKEITQIAGGAAMVDYMTTEEIDVLFKAYLARKAANPNRPLVFRLGMYQETANQYGSRFISALKRILATASKHQVNIKPLKLK